MRLVLLGLLLWMLAGCAHQSVKAVPQQAEKAVPQQAVPQQAEKAVPHQADKAEQPHAAGAVQAFEKLGVGDAVQA